MTRITRRQFAQAAGFTLAGSTLARSSAAFTSPIAGERPRQDARITVINPRGRVPLSLIIDDSTPLVNLAHFGIPHFAEVFPDRYLQDWRSLPREIPDAFVRRFAEWCRDHTVKGKYSVVPYPACVGWVDRDLPGWSKQELRDSLRLIREDLAPDWDFHPEMVSHTWAINPRTGRAFEERSEYFMENWRWTDGKSVDELAEYIAFALSILRNAEIPCEGHTTPGGFGNRVLAELSLATLEACRDVFQTEIPHYFRHLYTDERSVAPRVEFVSGLDSDDPRCVVSIIGCTGDWFGGWDGLEIGSVERFITEDGAGGRLPEVIERGEPAILVCHWPGIYCNGDEYGFDIFKETVRRLHGHYDHLLWMKLSEIARYWAAKELTTIRLESSGVHFSAPFACPNYTVRMPARPAPLRLEAGGESTQLRERQRLLDLRGGDWTRDGDHMIACFDLSKGESALVDG